MMEGTLLLQLPEGMLIDHIQAIDTGLLIAVTATALTSRCPLCGEVSSSIHSSYRRSLRDVPCGGRQVQLWLMVRKFFCHNALCERKVFTERLSIHTSRQTVLRRVMDLPPVSAGSVL
jgi:transposase